MISRADRTATFRFHGELDDFLPVELHGRDLAYAFRGNPSVKDAIEAQGVPHAEVDAIVVNGRSVDFSYQLRAGDRAAVYPVSASPEVRPVLPLRAPLLRRSAFVVDVNLGKLARWLRLLGFDTLYRNDFRDAQIAAISAEQGRVLLTRDRLLLHQKVVTHGYWVRSVNPEAQVAEVVRRFRLDSSIRPFHRCLACNGLIHGVARSEVLAQLEPKTRRYYDEFYRCADCGRVYWKGPHFTRLEDTVARLRSTASKPVDDPA